MINTITNLLNNDYTRMVIIISVIIYISLIDLPLSNFDKIIQTIFNSIVGQLFILLLLNHYLTNKDYGISLLLIVLYCFIIKIKMSSNIIKDYSETNKNEKNNLIDEKLSDLDSESSVSNNIEESLSDKNDVEYINESDNTEINDYINNMNNDGINNEIFETEKVEMKGGNKKEITKETKKETKKEFIKKMTDKARKHNFDEIEFKNLATLLEFENEKGATQNEYDEIIRKITEKQKELEKKEEKFINILDNNIIYNEDNTKILDIKKKNKKQELLKIIERNKKLDLNDDNILDWRDNKLNLKQWEKDMDKWMPTKQALNEWSEMYDKMIDIKSIQNPNKGSSKKNKNKNIGGANGTLLNQLEALEKKLTSDYKALNEMQK